MLLQHMYSHNKCMVHFNPVGLFLLFYRSQPIFPRRPLTCAIWHWGPHRKAAAHQFGFVGFLGVLACALMHEGHVVALHHHHLSSGARGGVGFSGVLGLDFRILKMYLGVVGIYQGILPLCSYLIQPII